MIKTQNQKKIQARPTYITFFFFFWKVCCQQYFRIKVNSLIIVFLSTLCRILREKGNFYLYFWIFQLIIHFLALGFNFSFRLCPSILFLNRLILLTELWTSIHKILMKRFSLKFNIFNFFFQSLIHLGFDNYLHLHVQVVSHHLDFFVVLFANHPALFFSLAL